MIRHADGTTAVLPKSVSTKEGSAQIQLVDNRRSFSDVDNNSWYSDGIQYAASRELLQGVAPGTFAPHSPLTRESLAVLLYRYAGHQGLDRTAQADLSNFGDSGSVSTWAEEAMAWACANGLPEGSAGSLPCAPAPPAPVLRPLSSWSALPLC